MNGVTCRGRRKETTRLDQVQPYDCGPLRLLFFWPPFLFRPVFFPFFPSRAVPSSSSPYRLYIRLTPLERGRWMRVCVCVERDGSSCVHWCVVDEKRRGAGWWEVGLRGGGIHQSERSFFFLVFFWRRRRRRRRPPPLFKSPRDCVFSSRAGIDRPRVFSRLSAYPAQKWRSDSLTLNWIKLIDKERITRAQLIGHEPKLEWLLRLDLVNEKKRGPH